MWWVNPSTCGQGAQYTQDNWPMKLWPQYCSFHWNVHYTNSTTNWVKNVIKFVRHKDNHLIGGPYDIFGIDPKKHSFLAGGACRLDTRLYTAVGSICNGKDLYLESDCFTILCPRMTPMCTTTQQRGVGEMASNLYWYGGRCRGPIVLRQLSTCVFTSPHRCCDP